MSDANEKQEWEDFFTKGIETIAGQRYEIERLNAELDIAYGDIASIRDDKNSVIERLTADCEMKDKRIDWTVADNAKKAIEIECLQARVDELEGVIKELAPYTDSLICYASTITEHDGNRVAKLLNDYAKALEGK